MSVCVYMIIYLHIFDFNKYLILTEFKGASPRFGSAIREAPSEY